MARFRFQLESLRRLRETTRTDRRLRLAEAFRAREIVAEQQDGLTGELAACRDQQRLMMAEGVLDANHAVQQQRYQLALESRVATLSEHADALEAEIERRRIALAQADQEVRLLDKLEARQRAEFNGLQQRQEMQQLDETAARIFLDQA